MEKLPRFAEEKQLAESLKTPQAVFAYEKLALGGQIKKARQKMRIKQAALAKKLGTSQSAVARMEAGKQNFTIKTLVDISCALGKRLHVKMQ